MDVDGAVGGAGGDDDDEDDDGKDVEISFAVSFSSIF